MEMQFNYCALMCLLWFNDSPGKHHGTRRSQSHLFAEESGLLKVQPVVERRWSSEAETTTTRPTDVCIKVERRPDKSEEDLLGQVVDCRGPALLGSQDLR